MIQKKMIGRLGNQLFQYATIRAYMEKYQIQCDIGLNFDICRSSSGDGFDDSLQLYNVLPYQEIGKLHYTVSQLPFIFVIKAYEKLIYKCVSSEKQEFCIYRFEKRIQKLINYFGIFWVTNGYIPFGKCRFNRNNLIFSGFFESAKYFDDIRDILLKEFTPKKTVRDCVKSLSEKLQEDCFVCISIRRGDFVTNDKYRKLHFVCDDAYFTKAMEVMEKKVPHCKYFVCSDDIDWCKQNMKFPSGTIFEEHGNSLTEKILLMSSCKHFIVSNSTFSWWVQYLSCNNAKVVLAPSIWRRNDYTLGKYDNDIYEENWIKL